MTLNACQLYMRDEIFGGKVNGSITGPLPPWNDKPIKPQIQPPVPGVLQIAQPHVYIWGADWTDRRIANPRTMAPGNPPGTFGWRQKSYNLQLYLIADCANTGQYPDSAFELLINSVEKAFFAAQMPADLVDPYTGDMSQFFNLGEFVNGSFDPPRTLSDQRFLRYLCRLTCQVKENYQS